MPPRLTPPRPMISSSRSQPSVCLQCIFQQRQFSGTPVPQLRVPKVNRMRRAMYAWFEGPGAAFKEPRAGSTNYLGAYDSFGNLIRGETQGREAEKGKEEDSDKDKQKNKDGQDGESERKGVSKAPPESLDDLRPFPLNRFFRSEAVLSEPLRDEIHRRVKEQGQTIREVSAALSVTMERVSAVVRMKEIQRNRDEEENPLLDAYQKIVMNMLPQTPFEPGQRSSTRHESINDLPVHPATLIQMFHPTSESRHFTRVDAGRVFHPRLLPADERIPHPEMIDAGRDQMEGVPQHQRNERMRGRYERIEQEAESARTRAERREQRNTEVVEGTRWDFKFKDVSADAAGRDGRGRDAVGWRYGQPVEDRKKGQKKIPMRVD